MQPEYPSTDPGTILQDYDFTLPEAQIATQPPAVRTASRLLVAGTAGNEHTTFEQLERFLRPGDLLVANHARVCPWRLEAQRKSTGAAVELLLLGPPLPGRVEAFCRPAKRVRPGEILQLADGLEIEVLDRDGPRCGLSFPAGATQRIEAIGQLPLPPYIVQRRKQRGEPIQLPQDPERYQTVYAKDSGAVAAPTAGLHFTPELIAALQQRGIGWVELSLLVGPGTFEPVRVERIAEHQVAGEHYRIPPATWSAIEATRKSGGAVVSVGTTTCRALESAAHFDPPHLEGEADLTILPGYRFRVVDALITNFHLPQSSLLLLVSAFAGRSRVLQAYAEAVGLGYRFYSYGDAMLLDRRRLTD